MTTVDFYDKEQVDDLLEDKADVTDVGTSNDVPSASGTLWARIKYVFAHWLTADTEQTVTAKKTFSVSPRVPTEPADDDSAISSFYANDSTGTVENNLIHKDGNEIKEGIFGVSNANGNFDVYATTGNLNINTYVEKGSMGPEYSPSSNLNSYMFFRDKDNNIIGDILVQHTTARNSNFILQAYNRITNGDNIDNVENALKIVVTSTGERRIDVSQDQRDFSPTNTKDIVTIKSLIQALRYYGLIQ